MSITVNSYSVTDGLLVIDSTVTSPANYKINTFYVLCNGHYADEVVPFWDRVNPPYQQVMTTANRRSYIDLSIFPNGSLTFNVRCKHAKTVTPVGSILEDTPVDIVVENTWFRTLLTPLPTTYPMGVISLPPALAFTAQPTATANGDGSATIQYGTYDPLAEDSATVVNVLATISDRQTIREAASAIVTAGVSVTDARRMVEAVTATAQSAASVTATVTQVEQLLAQIDAFPTVADIMTIAGQIAGVPYIFTSQPTLSMSTGDGGVIAYGTADTGAEDVVSAATATAQISEVVQSLEGLVATVAAIPTVADVLSQLETVASTAQAQASVVDEAVKGIAEDLATTATALADVADLQLMVDNLTVMAESGASLEELAAYTDAVTSAAVIQDSVADVLRSRDAIRYFLASICSPRNFADIASPRIFSSQCSPGRA